MGEISEELAVEAGESSRVEAVFQGLIDNLTSKEFRNQVIWSIGSVVLALIVAAVIMTMGGYNPGAAFLWLAVGAFSQFDLVLWYASPLIIAGLSVALAFRCGLFNIGAEGQLYIGAMAAALMAYLFTMPYVIHPIVCLAVGVLAGALWGFVPGLLKAYRGAHEVVTTMMLSYTAILFTSWLVGPNGPFWDGSMVPQTPKFEDTALLPVLFGYNLHFGFIIALMAVFVIDYFINRTVLGFELRAVGHNIDAAEFAGIDSKKKVATTLAISGGLSGLAGSTEIIGTYDRFIANWSAGIGWDGITVAVLGNNNPWGVLVGGIFFGALKAGGNTMQVIARVPVEMVQVIQGLIVLFVAAPRIISWLKDHTVDVQEDAQKEPVKVIPRLLVSIFGLASVFLGLGVSRIILITAVLTPVVAFAAFTLMIVAVTGVLVFIAAYSKNPRGELLLLLTAIGWVIGGVTFYIGSGTLDVTSFLMGGLSFVFWVFMRMLAKTNQEGGVVQ
ncbi:MAG: ABC transporter permease [Candidatus Thorarchaeota archaeon]